MKKILCVFCFLTLLFTCACTPNGSQAQAQLTIPDGFESDCTVKTPDMEIQAHIVRQSAQNCVITVTAPETLNGVTVECSGDTVSLCYGAIKQPLDIKKIPQAAFAPAIIRALDGISNYKEQNAGPVDSVLNISTAFGDIVTTLDEQTGAIKTIEMPSQQVTVTFSSFKALT